MEVQVTRYYRVTIPRGELWEEVANAMTQQAEDSGHPFTNEDLERNVLLGNMAMFLIDQAQIGNYTELVEMVDYKIGVET